MKKIFPLLMITLTFTGFLFVQVAYDVFNTRASRVTTAAKQKAKMEKAFKKLELVDINGRKYSEIANSAKVVIVNFWASWCSPCLQEIPSLNDLSSKYPEQKLKVIGINTGDEFEAMGRIVKNFSVNYPVIFDESELALTFDIENLPTTLIFVDGKYEKTIEEYIDFNSENFQSYLSNIL